MPVSNETFRVRLRALVDRDGIEGVQDFYGVTRRTVRNWISGETSPRASNTARSVSRRGQRITGNVIQTRNEATGRFETRLRGRGAQAYRAQEERVSRRREIAIQEANTPADRARAESMPTEPDLDAWADWEQRYNDLQEATQLGYLDDFYDYYGYDYDWEDFRTLYEQMSG